ncbi:MAG TPA: polyphosphate kinase 2, partial [Aurantimonas coralicida]|nr:polyphosphate kinase 2 [Aurantimonas coralicida]HET99399.1 polyphosphate kinase 2 [Aurantimonas coralicida]
DKKQARLNVIRHLMSRVDCPNKDEHAAQPDPKIVFAYDNRHLESGAIAP